MLGCVGIATWSAAEWFKAEEGGWGRDAARAVETGARRAAKALGDAGYMREELTRHIGIG